MDPALASLMFMLGAQFDPKTSTWTVSFIAPDESMKMRSYAVAVPGTAMVSPSPEDAMMALKTSQAGGRYIEL